MVDRQLPRRTHSISRRGCLVVSRRADTALGPVAEHDLLLDIPAPRRSGIRERFAVVALGYCMIAPTSNSGFLIPLLALAALVGLGSYLVLFLNHRAVVARSTLVAFGIFVLGALVSVHGWSAANPGAFDVGVAIAGGPLTWMAFSLIPCPRVSRWMPTLLVVSSMIVSVLILATAFRLNIPGADLIDASRGRSARDGLSRVRLTSAWSLIALLPMLVALELRGSAVLSNRESMLVRLALALTTVATVVGGRQINLLLLIASPLITGFVFAALHRNNAKRRRRFVSRLAVSRVLGVSTVAAVLVTRSSFGLYVNRFLAALGMAEDVTGSSLEGNYAIRIDQTRRLVEFGLERPFTGWGAGQVVPGLVRSLEFPWRFESQYGLAFVEGGILGIAIYLFLAVQGWRAIRAVSARVSERDSVLLGVLSVGSLMALVAHGTNPYLRAVGLQWAGFLPLMLASWLTMASSSKTPGTRRTE